MLICANSKKLNSISKHFSSRRFGKGKLIRNHNWRLNVVVKRVMKAVF